MKKVWLCGIDLGQRWYFWEEHSKCGADVCFFKWSVYYPGIPIRCRIEYR